MKPRVKMFGALLLAILIIGGGYTVLVLRNKAVDYEAPADSFLVATATTSLSPQVVDTDKDGLPDWEEILWKTDPNNPDTDGDGTPDGDEVKKNRNPLVRGPGDALTNEDVSSITDSELTPTQKLARDLLIAHYQLTQGDGTGAPDPNYSAEAVLARNSVSLTHPSYLPSQLTQVPDDSASIKNYATNIQSVLNKYMGAEQLNEVRLLQAAGKKEDPATIEALKKRSDEYQRAVKEFLSMPVPKSAVTVHIGLVSSLAFLGESVRAMSNNKDPLTAMAGLREYPNALLAFSKRLKDLQLYFK